MAPIFNFMHPSAFIPWCFGVEECTSAHLRDLAHSMGTVALMWIHSSSSSIHVDHTWCIGHRETLRFTSVS
jgi:hypothetical protein